MAQPDRFGRIVTTALSALADLMRAMMRLIAAATIWATCTGCTSLDSHARNYCYWYEGPQTGGCPY